METYEEKHREHWVFGYSAQVELMGSQIWWVSDAQMHSLDWKRAWVSPEDYHKKHVCIPCFCLIHWKSAQCENDLLKRCKIFNPTVNQMPLVCTGEINEHVISVISWVFFITSWLLDFPWVHSDLRWKIKAKILTELTTLAQQEQSTQAPNVKSMHLCKEQKLLVLFVTNHYLS